MAPLPPSRVTLRCGQIEYSYAAKVDHAFAVLERVPGERVPSLMVAPRRTVAISHSPVSYIPNEATFQSWWLLAEVDATGLSRGAPCGCITLVEWDIAVVPMGD